ncbi:3-ketoacyl-reductase [Atractiella rhizophila]|nr:3-ketoacyl-reductase [Atractiella rhizophila]KAH8922324.1 3-ketoacyl-reductase [Atractiella rhizophila]
MTRLAGKVALVTGGSNGFGLAITQKFVAEGAKVVVLDLSKLTCEGDLKEGETVISLTGSITVKTDWENAVEAAKKHFGRLDIVVNNAGINMTAHPSHLVEESFYDKLMDINLKSIYRSVTACTPIMLEQKSGVFIHISSVGGLRPKPQIAYYNATKAAVIAISKTLAVEYAPYIRSIAIAPSMGNTGMLAVNLGHNDPVTDEMMKPFLSTIPMKRLCEPSDVANVACFAASDEASYMTGNVIEIDGGRCA